MRTRAILPGFWRNEELGVLSGDIRLLALGLTGLADREGRMEYRPMIVWREVFGYRAVSVDDVVAWIDVLASVGFVQRYAVDGREFLAVVNFKKHQHCHPHEAASQLPPPPNPSNHAMPGHVITCNDMSRNDMKCTAVPSVPSVPSVSSKEKILAVRKANSPPTSHIEHTPDKLDPTDVVALWHEVMPDLPKVRKLTTARRASIAARIREDLPDADSWRRMFTYIRTRPFLMGQTKPTNGHTRPFRATLFWFCKADNFAKLSEDFYA